jgi:hypothetical protein
VGENINYKHSETIVLKKTCGSERAEVRDVGSLAVNFMRIFT